MLSIFPSPTKFFHLISPLPATKNNTWEPGWTWKSPVLQRKIPRLRVFHTHRYSRMNMLLFFLLFRIKMYTCIYIYSHCWYICLDVIFFLSSLKSSFLFILSMDEYTFFFLLFRWFSLFFLNVVGLFLNAL